MADARSKRSWYTTAFEVVGVHGEQRDAPLEVVEPVEPVMTCSTRPANARPDVPCSRISAARSS